MIYNYKISAFWGLGLLLALACEPIDKKEDKDISPPKRLNKGKVKHGFLIVPNSYGTGSKLVLAFDEQVTMNGWREDDGRTQFAALYLKAYRGDSNTSLWAVDSENAKIKPLEGEGSVSASGDAYRQFWILTLGTALQQGDTLYPVSSKIHDAAGNSALPKADDNALVFKLPAPDTTVPKAYTTIPILADGYGDGDRIQLHFDDYVHMNGWKFSVNDGNSSRSHAAPFYFNVSRGTWNDATTGGTILPVSGYFTTFDSKVYASVWVITLAGNTGLAQGDKLFPKTGQVVDLSGNAAVASDSGSAAFTLPTPTPK